MIHVSGDSGEQLRPVIKFGRSSGHLRDDPVLLTPKKSGPHRRPGRVSDACALGSGVLLISISWLGALLLEKAC